MKKREVWSTQFGFILASAGAAIGLGQIWKFPYMTGQNGGSSFVFFYFLFIALLAVPSFLGEVTIGALGKKGPVDSLRELSKKYGGSPLWKYLGYLGLVTLFLVLCFYNVAASWALAFMGKSLMTASVSPGFFGELLSSPLLMFFYFLLYTVTCYVVVALGVRKGIERVCLFLLPPLFLILIFIVLWSTSLEGFGEACLYLFSFNLEKINMTVLMEAAGHALFSLATGAGCALVYGSHVPEGVKIGQATLAIVVGNLFVAILAGLAIFPTVFTFHLSPAAGPTLMFEVLPRAFSEMSYGVVIANAFFFVLLSAALTSTISLIEPLVATLIEKFNFSRKLACLLVFLVSLPPSIMFILSFNLLGDVTIFGKGIFEFFADYMSSFLLSIGAICFAFFATRVIPKHEFMSLFSSSKGEKCLGTLAHKTLYYLVPLALVVILLNQILSHLSF